MNKIISGLILIVMLSVSCSKGTKTPCRAVITGYERESGKWQGYIGTDWKTHIKTLDGYIDDIPGKCGSIGDTINGWWAEGYCDVSLNGFRKTN